MIRLALNHALRRAPPLKRRYCTATRLWLKRGEYWIYYCPRTLLPIYSFEHIRTDRLPSKSSSRNRMKEDSELAPQERATQQDYKHSGYDRGHLAPIANYEDPKPTNTLANACPQHPRFNREIWALVEQCARQVVRQEGKATIYTGPIYRVWRGTIGPNRLPIASHFFKVVKSPAGKICWVVPHTAEPLNQQPASYLSTLEKVERAAGITLIPPPEESLMSQERLNELEASNNTL